MSIHILSSAQREILTLVMGMYAYDRPKKMGDKRGEDQVLQYCSSICACQPQTLMADQLMPIEKCDV